MLKCNPCGSTAVDILTTWHKNTDVFFLIKCKECELQTNVDASKRKYMVFIQPVREGLFGFETIIGVYDELAEAKLAAYRVTNKTQIVDLVTMRKVEH